MTIGSVYLRSAGSDGIAAAPVESSASVSSPPVARSEGAQTADAPDTREAEIPDHPAMRRYAELTRYAASSRRIDENSLDLLNPNSRHERRQPLPGSGEGDDPTYEVRFTADRYALRGDESTRVRFELWRDGEPIEPTGLRLVAKPGRGSGADADDRHDKEVRLGVRRDGLARTALLTPHDHWPEHLGKLQIAASFSAPGLSEKSGTLTFYFTPKSRLPGRLTGRFDDRISRGDLVIDVGVEIRVAGTYRIEGNLFDRHDEPIAWARFQGDLHPGSRKASLVFDGLIFRDADARPPFVLRTVRGHRMRPGDAPHREDLQDYAGEYRVDERYALSDFRSEPRKSPRTQAMMELYRDALERGVRLGEAGGAGARR
jgi:hypothetical protein